MPAGRGSSDSRTARKTRMGPCENHSSAAMLRSPCTISHAASGPQHSSPSCSFLHKTDQQASHMSPLPLTGRRRKMMRMGAKARFSSRCSVVVHVSGSSCAATLRTASYSSWPPARSASISNQGLLGKAASSTRSIWPEY